MLLLVSVSQGERHTAPVYSVTKRPNVQFYRAPSKSCGRIRSPPGLGGGHLDGIRASNGQVQAGFSGIVMALNWVGGQGFRHGQDSSSFFIPRSCGPELSLL